MKSNNIILTILLAVLGLGGWWIYNHYKTPTNSVNNMHSDHKDIYYCPMHPQVVSDKPGSCPICFMKLVKKEPSVKSTENKQDNGYATVSVNPQKQQLMGIKTEKIVRKSLIKTLHAYGYVAHDLELYDAQIEYIEAWQKFYPFLVRRNVKAEFKSDWRDYSLKEPSQGRWRSDEKLKAQQRLIKAEYELVHMGINETQLAQLREIKYGQPWVQPDLLFFQENHPVWIYAQVLESDLGFIALGQKAQVTLPTYGETVEGVVRTISRMIDPATRTTQVRIELPAYKGELNVNMYANIDFPVELDEGIVVPREAIMDTGLNKIVFVETKEGVFEPRKIQTGFEGDGMVAVKSGLKEGGTIVISGNFLLDSESRLQASLMGGHNHD